MDWLSISSTHSLQAQAQGSTWLRQVLTSLFMGEYMPHGHCYFWEPALVALNVASDVLIGAAYMLISVVLYILVRRIQLPFSTMIVAFGAFIGACGLTHFMEVWNVWNGAYWLAGGIKAVTAAASVLTGVFLVQLRPQVVKVASAARLSEERREELESKNRELETLYARLKAAEVLRTQFFANVSHELRTPLALILGPVERMLTRAALVDEQRQDLETVARSGQLLLKQVNDLLDAAKLEAGKMEARYTETDVAELVRTTTAFFSSVATERSLAYEVDAAGPLVAQVDVEKLQRVLINLLSNAFKFAPAGGRVRTTLRKEGSQAVLVVDDTGPGVKPEQRELIFERFQQGDGGTTRHFGGTGLGLAIAKDFITLQKGTLSVEDAPEGGARFSVTLPLRAPDGTPVSSRLQEAELSTLAASARPSVEQLRVTPGAPASMVGHGTRVALVVEDNPEMSRFIAETLAPEFQVMTAADGREGLEKARALRPDVLVTDMMMPRMSGEQLVHALRADSEFDSIPVLLVTAKADDELRVRLLRQGAQDYLTKPFLAEELLARASNLAVTKRARDVLQRELAAKTGSLEGLAEELALRKRELEASLEVASHARQQVEQVSQAKSTFLRLVSHELRTPLTGIQLHLQVLARKGELSSALERLARSFQRLNSLVESILEYTHLEAHRPIARIEEFDLGAMGAELVEELLPEAQQKLLRLELLAVPKDLPPLRSDPRLVRLVLLNLVVNAVKYTQRGSIEVSVEYSSEGHRVRVKDTGPGIEPEAQERIFEPFVQVEPIQHKHIPGLGLGLALVKQMLELLGGRIELRSVVGQGSTFTVVLPSQAPATLVH